MPTRSFAEEKFRETLRRWRLFEPGRPILVAVSGGIDSVVLLHLLKELPEKSRPKISVAHFNHRLRGRSSGRDEAFVKGLCRDWGLPFASGRAPVWKSRENLEARAREMRYEFLRKTAARRKIRGILTAHHADDQAETFLIRWLQGAGLRGLSGMPFRRGWVEGRCRVEIIRPLLLVSREEIRIYARAHGLPYRDDPTNRSKSLLRARVRRLLKPLRRENPNLAGRCAVNALFLQADEAYLGKIVEEFFVREVERGKGSVRLKTARYLSLPPAIRYRLLQKMAQALISPSHALPAEAVFKVNELLEDPGTWKHYDLPSRLGFRKEKGIFEFFAKK